MKLRHLYLAFALVGLLLPYSQFLPWIMEHHAMNIPLFIHDLFANQISAFFAMDVIVSAIVLIVFILDEGQRQGDANPVAARDSHFTGRRFGWSSVVSLFTADPT